jgi:hypothetical protein
MCETRLLAAPGSVWILPHIVGPHGAELM